MSPTPRTRRIGRLRTVVVLAAMAVGMFAGSAAPALAAPSEKADHGLQRAAEARGLSEGDVTAAGWSWFR